MAERFYGYGYSPVDNVQYIARVYDTDFSGTSTEFELMSGGIQIGWEATETDDRHSPIFGSSCKITMSLPVSDVTLNEFVDDVRTSKEGRFWMELVSGGGATVRWRGILVADISNERDESARYAVTMTAVCGLALLKKIPYLAAGALQDGSVRLTKHLTACLSKLSHASLWGTDDDFLETSVDWWAETMSTGGANDALYQAYADHAAFYDYHTKGTVDKDVLSCYDVIQNIVQSFGARIGMLDGMFKVEQIDYRSNSTYEYRRYKKDGTFISNSGYSGVNTINQTKFGAKLSYVEYDYIPQLSKALVTYQANLRRNFWGNIILKESFTYNFNQEISSNSGAAVFRVRGMFFVTIKNNTYSGNPQDIIFTEMRLALKIGSNYLKREGSYSNFSFHPAAASWSASAGDKCWIVSSGQKVPVSGLSLTFIFAFDFMTPPLPSDGAANSVSATFFQLKRNNNEDVTESEFTITWTAGSMFLDVFDDGTPDVLEDEILYETVNPDDGTAIWETDVRLGGGSPNYQGRLFNSSNYNYQTWAQGTDTPELPLGALLSMVVLDGQLRPIKRLNGQLRGTLSPWKLIRTSDSIDWLPMRITWSPLENLLDGSWFEVDYGTAGVPSTPIKVKILTGGTKLPQIPGPSTPVPTGGGNQGFAANSPGIMLAPVAFNNLATAITAGATITSIPITVASTGDEFLTGDGVTLSHPITGQYQTFTIASAPALGATSLSVTSATADFDAPVGSFLVVKQKAFAFSLPPATQGQILRFNAASGLWEAYSGTVDGYVLTWDTTNGWQEEASGGGGGSGTVTSVALSMPAIFNVSGSPVTTSGTLTAILANQAINLFFISPVTGSAGAPTFRAMDSADIPANIVTLPKLQQVATAVFLGRITAGTGDVETLSVANAKTLLNLAGTNNGDQTITLTGDVTGSGTGSFPATIAANVVTLAKMAQVATARFLGRVTAATGNVEALTGAQATTLLDAFTSALKGLVPASGGGTINFLRADGSFAVPPGAGVQQSGTLVNNRLAISAGSNLVKDSAAFVVDVTNGRMTITNITPGFGIGQANLNFAVPTGATNAIIHAEGNVSGVLSMTIFNVNAINSGAAALLTLATGGAGGGDPMVQFIISTLNTWAIGIDNSDGDKFKITKNSTPGGTANEGLIITTDSPPRVGINLDAPLHPLDVSGITRAGQFRQTANVWSGANIAFGSGAGTGPSINSISGGNNGFQINFTTGTGPVNNGIIFTATYPTAYGSLTYVAKDGRGDPGGVNFLNEQSKFNIDSAGATNFVLKANGVVTATKQYSMNFIIMGY